MKTIKQIEKDNEENTILAVGFLCMSFFMFGAGVITRDWIAVLIGMFLVGNTAFRAILYAMNKHLLEYHKDQLQE